MSIYDAAMLYSKNETDSFGGKEYGTGSSRDWLQKERGC